VKVERPSFGNLDAQLMSAFAAKADIRNQH